MSFGVVQAMIASIKNNKKQLYKRDNYFKKGQDPNFGAYGKLEDHKKMSSYEFKIFQKKLRENEAQRQRKVYFTFGSVMLVIISVLCYFLFFS
jgi:uridine kinase